MKFHTLAALGATASLLAFSFASAQGARPLKLKVACAAEMQRFCPTAAPGKEAMRCMKGHMNEASAGCQSAVQAKQAMRAQRRAAGSSNPRSFPLTGGSQGAPPPPSSPQ